MPELDIIFLVLSYLLGPSINFVDKSFMSPVFYRVGSSFDGWTRSTLDVLVRRRLTSAVLLLQLLVATIFTVARFSHEEEPGFSRRDGV